MVQMRKTRAYRIKNKSHRKFIFKRPLLSLFGMCKKLQKNYRESQTKNYFYFFEKDVTFSFLPATYFVEPIICENRNRKEIPHKTGFCKADEFYDTRNGYVRSGENCDKR